MIINVSYSGEVWGQMSSIFSIECEFGFSVFFNRFCVCCWFYVMLFFYLFMRVMREDREVIFGVRGEREIEIERIKESFWKRWYLSQVLKDGFFLIGGNGERSSEVFLEIKVGYQILGFEFKMFQQIEKFRFSKGSRCVVWGGSEVQRVFWVYDLKGGVCRYLSFFGEVMFCL